MDDSYYKQQEPFFGSWTIEKKLGEGGSGKVYLIADRSSDQITYAAMKAISIPANDSEKASVKAEFQNDQDSREHYKAMVDEVVNELLLLDRLTDCNNIVSYQEHQVREHEDGIGWDIFIREEKLTPLIDLMATRNFTEDDVINVGVDICTALEACEGARIIHRDVKPENIFVDDDGNYKLGDFGIAKTMSRTVEGITKKGTFEYMAPEIYRKESGTTQVDLYSLGIVLYKMLNDNRGPFIPAYPNAIMYADRESALSKRFKGAVITPPKNGSDSLKDVVLTACAFSPAERFRSATEMKESLLQIRNRAPSVDSEVRSKKPVRYAVVVATLAVLVCVVAGFFAWWGHVKDITGIDNNVELYIGESLAPDYQIVPERLNDRQITFEAEGSSIEVTEQGIISGVELGESRITISCDKYSEEVTVNVIPKVTDIKGLPANLEMTEGESFMLDVTLKPDNFKDEEVTFVSSDESIISVSQSGQLLAKKPGNASINVAAGGCATSLEVVVAERPEPARKPAKRNATTSKNKKHSKKAKKVKPAKKKAKSKKKYSDVGDFGGDEYF